MPGWLITPLFLHTSLSLPNVSLEVVHHSLNHAVPTATTQMHMRLSELTMPSFITSVEQASADSTASHTSPQPEDQQCEHNDYSETN